MPSFSEKRLERRKAEDLLHFVQAYGTYSTEGDLTYLAWAEIAKYVKEYPLDCVKPVEFLTLHNRGNHRRGFFTKPVVVNIFKELHNCLAAIGFMNSLLAAAKQSNIQCRNCGSINVVKLRELRCADCFEKTPEPTDAKSST